MSYSQFSALRYPAGKLIFHVLASIAKFERDLSSDPAMTSKSGPGRDLTADLPLLRRVSS
jgi:hypothetical protein